MPDVVYSLYDRTRYVQVVLVCVFVRQPYMQTLFREGVWLERGT